MEILNVFTDKGGNYGTPLGIIEDIDKKIPFGKRLKLTKQSGFTEVVFIESISFPEISIYTPEQHLPFASHALIGAHFYLTNKYNVLSTEILSMGRKIKVGHENSNYYSIARVNILPKFNIKQLPFPLNIDNLTPKETNNFEHTLVWAWQNEDNGEIRARTFAPDWNITEDEANGSGSMILAHTLGRDIEIFHGKGSVIHAAPITKKLVSVGGFVKYKSNIHG